MLILIDLSAEFFRNAHGSRSAMTGYELTLDRVDFYRREYPRTVVCCDSPKSKRRDAFPAYKANRVPKNAQEAAFREECLDSLRAIQDRMVSWGIPVVQCDGYEADDVIATLCEQAWPEEIMILGTEKDLYALISDTTVLLDRSGRLIGTNDCFEKFGVLPGQMRDWLALVGDASDNIPGCPGCGPKRGTDLFQRFGTLPEILSAPAAGILSIKGIGDGVLGALKAWDPKLALSMVTLMTDAPVSLAELFTGGTPQ